MKNKYYRRIIIYYYLINYISLHDIDLKEEEDIFLHDDFLEILLYVLENNDTFNYFTEEMYKRIGKLIIYIRKNMESEFIEDILKAYNKINNYSYNFYENEFICKYNIIDNNLTNKIFIWDKKEIERLVKDDYYMLLILELKDKDFYENYMDKFIYNKEFLLFVNKLINVFPRVLLDKKYKNKILKIIEYNKERIDDEDFTNINNNLYNRIQNINRKNIDGFFTTRNFESIYYEVVFEKMIVLGESYDLNYSNELILEYLYEFIEYYSISNLCTKHMKNRIINIMDRFKYGVKNIDLTRYNEHLVMVNSMKENEYGFIKNYLNKKGIYNHNEIYSKPYIIDEYLEMINLDFAFLESLLCDEYDKKYLKHFIYNDDYVLTIKRYLNDCPMLFNDKNVYDKVIKTLKAIMDEYESGNLNSRDYYLQNKKMLKRLEKGKF